jgi:hypothetical protein
MIPCAAESFSFPESSAQARITLKWGRFCFQMLLKVTALEDIQSSAFVSLLFHDSNQIYCRNSTASERPDAIAARNIAKGESIDFDTGRNTSALLRPSTGFYGGR